MHSAACKQCRQIALPGRRRGMQRREVGQQGGWMKLSEFDLTLFICLLVQPRIRLFHECAIFALYAPIRRLLWSTPFKNLQVAHWFEASPSVGFDRRLVAR
jgi:hypothetical protein